MSLGNRKFGAGARKSSRARAKIFPVIFFATSFIGATTIFPARKVFAAGNNNCGVDTFFNWGCTGSGEQITPLLITIVNWLAVGVTIAVVGGIIYGAIMYTTSAGNQEQSKKAMGIIRNAIIALILYFAMWAALNWLVPGGMFN